MLSSVSFEPRTPTERHRVCCKVKWSWFSERNSLLCWSVDKVCVFSSTRLHADETKRLLYLPIEQLKVSCTKSLTSWRRVGDDWRRPSWLAGESAQNSRPRVCIGDVLASMVGKNRTKRATNSIHCPSFALNHARDRRLWCWSGVAKHKSTQIRNQFFINVYFWLRVAFDSAFWFIMLTLVRNELFSRSTNT